MLPLFITSFQRVRRKMAPKAWKKLQRWAYLFYALLCCHILLLTIPMAARGDSAYRLTVFVYGAIFLSYLLCKTSKALAKKHKSARPLGRQQAGVTLCCVLVSTLAVFGMGMKFPAAAVRAPDPTPAPAAVTEHETVPEPEPSEGSAATGWRDGVYTGSAMGMNAPIEVSVTIEGGEIVDVVVESQRDDEEYFNDALCVIDDILDTGGTNVDIVTGATYSSGGILDAVDNALEKAGG